MIPYSIFKLEKKYTRKKVLSIIVGIGIFTSIIYSYSLVMYFSEATVLGHHIIYKLNYPSWVLIQGSFFYGIATLFSYFISSAKRVWVLGILILLSYMIGSIYFQDYIISVWCYFAAIISTSIFFILKNINSKVEKI